MQRTYLTELIDMYLYAKKRPLSAKEIWDGIRGRYYPYDNESTLVAKVFGGEIPWRAIEDQISSDILDNKCTSYGKVGSDPVRFYDRSELSEGQALKLIEKESPSAQSQGKSRCLRKDWAKKNATYYSSRIAVHYVMAELFRRKCIMGSTEGNAAAIDLLGQTENGKHFSVQVKSMWTSFIRCWLVGYVEPEKDLFFVLVNIPPAELETPHFYVLTSEETMKLRQWEIEEYRKRRMQEEKPTQKSN